MVGALWIDGGAGADVMAGGSGSNHYVYTAASDSTASAMDVITNFSGNLDAIDLGLGQTLKVAGALEWKIGRKLNWLAVERWEYIRLCEYRLQVRSAHRLGHENRAARHNQFIKHELHYSLSDAIQRHCQVNRLQNKFRVLMPAHQALSHSLDRRLLSPGPKRFGPSTPIADCAEAMTPWLEVSVDDGVR
jgi:hypothetical protein